MTEDRKWAGFNSYKWMRDHKKDSNSELIIDYRWYCKSCGTLNWVTRVYGLGTQIICDNPDCSTEYYCAGTYFSDAEIFVRFKDMYPEKYKEIVKERNKKYAKRRKMLDGYRKRMRGTN